MVNTITISRYFDDDLVQTLKSIFSQTSLPEKIIIVISQTSEGEHGFLMNLIPCNILPRVIVVCNQDHSLYNAMNIGMKLVSLYSHCIFLNAGDLFISENIIDHVLKCCLKFPDSNIAFSTIQIHNSFKFLRYSKPSQHSKLVKIMTCVIPEALPPHQGFVSYKTPKTPFFLEVNTVNADSIWISYIINNEKVVYSGVPISLFKLGGVSSTLSLKKLLAIFSSFSILSVFRSICLLIPLSARTFVSATFRGYKIL